MYIKLPINIMLYLFIILIEDEGIQFSVNRRLYYS